MLIVRICLLITSISLIHSLASAEIEVPNDGTEACTPMQVEAGECDCDSQMCSRYMNQVSLNRNTRVPLMSRAGGNSPPAGHVQGTEHE